jgi:hypothetical protein
MVAPLAIAAGKKAAPVARAAARKAGDNPAGSLFLVVLAGAVLIQGVKNLPDLGSFLWGKLPVPDLGFVKAPYTWTREAIETTAALNDEVISGFEQIGPEQDPIERLIFGEDWSVEVYSSDYYEQVHYDDAGVPVAVPVEINRPGTAQKAYRGARTGLFTGLFNRGW